MSVMRKGGVGLAVLAGAAALAWALWPRPLAVDLAAAVRGPMEGSLTAQGMTRVREPYAITAPITGTASRSPVEVGDPVTAGETVVAVIRPADPALMDARSRAQAEAALAEAEAAVAVAESGQRQAELALSHATLHLERGQALADRGTISRLMLEDLQQARDTADQALSAARAQVDLARAARDRARAQMIGPDTSDPSGAAGECCLLIRAPQTGIVLSLADQSARLVQAGSPLLTVGSLATMEIELDLLSTDAVQVPAGAPAVVERWGGPGLLEARLRRVDPAAFTRVSALGIEEQRVRLRLDLLTPPEGRPGLGDGFRVHVRLILWRAGDVLQVPQAALFRQGDGWALFTEREGRARLTAVGIGRQAGGTVEVLSGPAEGDPVVLYPPATLADGARIVPRSGG